MSTLEQRTNEAFAGAPQIEAPAAWPAIDGELLDERRAAVPAFPLELLPPPWRDWVSEAARSADAPVDYVAQAVLATVAGVGGPGVWVAITKDWIEPLQLWLAVVGAPSTGKSPALLLVRRLLYALAEETIDGLAPPPRTIAVSEQTLAGVAQTLGKTRHGKLLWRDGAEGCFTPLKGMDSARQLEALDISILGTIEPDGVAPALRHGGQALAARFLYAWPHAVAFRPLTERKERVADEAAMGPLRRLLRLVASREGPCVLFLDEPAEKTFNAFLARLHGEVRQAEGLEAAWLGKGRGEVARLAATFALMDWSAMESAEPLHLIGARAMECAVSLWSDYYRPHARAFLQGVVSTDVESQARRVVRWLRTDGRAAVSRTEVRRSALSHTVDARGADRVVLRLVDAGVLRPIASEGQPRRGRPARRWQVNPMLATA